MTPVNRRLERLLGGDPLVSLRKRLRQRFERGPPDGSLERFRMSNLSLQEHAALASLLGRPAKFSSSIQVDVPIIDTALQRAGISGSLRQALEQIDGPIVHIATARRELEAAWTRVVSTASHPTLVRFLQTPEGVSLLKRLSGSDPEDATQLCSHVQAILSVLPANGITCAELAAKTLGDAHALDSGKAESTMVLAVWRGMVVPNGGADDVSPVPEDNGHVQDEVRVERSRDTWARAGVLVNELARPALFLNLPVRGDTRLANAPGEPSFASLRYLMRSSPFWNVAGQDVFVCENPNLLAIAADKLGSSCAPLVCTDGMPAAAQGMLLTQLAKAGGQLRYHGDFDWPGLQIGNHVIRQYGASPWRFGVVEYVAAIQSAPKPGRPLGGPQVVATWDTMLAPTMQTHQLTIAEESVVESLLQDLAGRDG